MLELLRIRDLALIEDLEMEFSSGMNVITGETGAGKSFILKALDFVTGEKAGADLVRPGKEKAVVEALFVVNGKECILRRELPAESGRSRLYVDDTLSSLESVTEMRGKLLLHTAQHGRQKLCRPAWQAAVLDGFMRRPDLLEEKDRLVGLLGTCAAKRAALEDKVRELREKRDMFEFQLAEIDAVKPKAGEEDSLEQARTAARNQTVIIENAVAGLAAFAGDDDGPGLWDTLTALERAVAALAKVHDGFDEASESLTGARDTLKDLEKNLRRVRSEAAEEADTEAIEERLYALAQLKRKLKRPLDEILNLHAEIAENLSFLDSCDLDRKHLAAEEEELAGQLRDLLQTLNPARRRAAEELAEALGAELRGLGFADEAAAKAPYTREK